MKIPLFQNGENLFGLRNDSLKLFGIDGVNSCRSDRLQPDLIETWWRKVFNSEFKVVLLIEITCYLFKQLELLFFFFF